MKAIDIFQQIDNENNTRAIEGITGEKPRDVSWSIYPNNSGKVQVHIYEVIDHDVDFINRMAEMFIPSYNKHGECIFDVE